MREKRNECKAMKEAGAQAYEMWESLKKLSPDQWSGEAQEFMDDPKFPKTEKAWQSYLNDIDDNYESVATKYNSVKLF